jgi:signal transduction histidine kinase
MELRRGIRPVDAVLTAVLCGLGSSLGIMNVLSDDPVTRIDSHSWLMVPVFVASAVPVLWWRRWPVGVTLFACTVMAVHVVAFGAVVRCGAGLPLSFTLAFLSGLVERTGVRAIAVFGSGLLTALVLIRDTAAGVELLPVALVLCGVLFGIARVMAHRSAMARDLRQRNEDLRRLRDERAALDVTDDRLRLSARLEQLLDQRLGQLARSAEDGTAITDPAATRAALTTLEEDSRRTLADMREIVGLLRGGEVSLAPVPSVAHLDALLTRHLRSASALRVSGEPRMLPASVELSAYRIVEHLITAFAGESPGAVDVTVTFGEAELEIRVAGPASRRVDLREAIGRARERARLHAGSLTVRTTRGRSRVVAHLPVLSGV